MKGSRHAGLMAIAAKMAETDVDWYRKWECRRRGGCGWPWESLVADSDGNKTATKHPMLGRRCLIRTYSAGVHIGDVVWINPENAMEVKLDNALRLWKWEGGGLSLSAVAANGINGGRINRTGEVLLTGAIEFIPTTHEAEDSYAKFIED